MAILTVVLGYEKQTSHENEFVLEIETKWRKMKYNF